MLPPGGGELQLLQVVGVLWKPCLPAEELQMITYRRCSKFLQAALGSRAQSRSQRLWKESNILVLFCAAADRRGI